MAKPKPSDLLLSIVIIAVIFSTSSSPTATASSSSKWFPPPRFGKFARDNNIIVLQQIRYETRYFEQQLDHFSFSELPRFRQRYLISTEHWSGPTRLGPIFVYCGNEGDIAWFASNTGFVWEIAPQFGAMVLFPEVSGFFFFFLNLNLFGSLENGRENIRKNESILYNIFIIDVGDRVMVIIIVIMGSIDTMENRCRTGVKRRPIRTLLLCLI